MKDFLMREISLKNGEQEVTRSRNSNGYGYIRIRKGGTLIDFGGESYEFDVRELGKMLIDIADNPCLLPEIKETKKK